MIKGFIFDLDGVITDSAEYHFLAWQKLGEKIGISFDRTFNESLKGISRMDSLERILAYGGKQDDFSDKEKQDLADYKNELYIQLIADVTAEDILPGILKLLNQLKAKGMKIALASTSKNGPFLLRQLGVFDYFDTIVDPQTLQAGKPSPEIFLKAATQLGLSPNECVGVEDAPAGIDAILAAGMFAVGVGQEQSLYKADFRVDKTDDLLLDNILKAVDAKNR